MDQNELPTNLPQEPQRPAHRVRKQSRVRRSVRVFMRRRGISLRRRRQREKLSVPLIVMFVLALIAVVASWDWFRSAELPWLGMGRCRLAFLVALAAALVSGVLFAINIFDVLGAREREQQREAEKRAMEDSGQR